MPYSSIGGLYRRKAVAKDWHANGEPLTVAGKVEFLQQTEYDITNMDVDLEGLTGVSDYTVHVVSNKKPIAIFRYRLEL